MVSGVFQYFYILAAYIHRCQISDPKFHDCVRESANKALWSVLEGTLRSHSDHKQITMMTMCVSGDKTFGFPELLPFQLPPFNFDLSENVNFKLTNGVSEVNRDVTYTDVQ